MSAENLSAQEAFERFEGMLRDSGGTRIDIDYHAIHRTGHVINWLTIDGQRKGVLFPAKMDFTMDKLRPAQVDAHRGAWLYSHLWMEASDGVLHQESDWMGEPDLGDGEPDTDRCTEELEMHPREPELTPHWLRTRSGIDKPGPTYSPPVPSSRRS